MEKHTEIVLRLTDWKEEPTLEDLKYDLEQARTSQSAHVANLDRWAKAFKNDTAASKAKQGQAGSRVQPKLIRKQYEWRCPALSEPYLTTDQLFKVSPVSYEDKERSVQNEMVLNYQFSAQIPKVQFIDTLIRTLVSEGTAIVRVGWEYQETVDKVPVPMWAYQPAPPEMQEQLQQAIQLLQTHPDEFLSINEQLQESAKASLQHQQPVLAIPQGQQLVEKPRTIVNRPCLEVCETRNVFIDPTCEGDLSKAQYVIHSFEASLSELKKDGRYKNLDFIQEANLGNNAPDHVYAAGNNSSITFKDKPRQKKTVYEYWGFRDIDGSGLVEPIVASWVDSVLIRLDKNPFPDQKVPFVIIPYLPIKRSVYGTPDGELLEDNQSILGAVTRGTIDLLGKSANSQTGVAKGLLDASNKIRYLRGDNYEFNPNQNPQTHIFTHKYPEIPQSAMFLINMMNMDAEAISGVKAFSSGGITGAGLGDTAAGVRGALDAASKREMSILRRISQGILHIGRKIISMNSEFLSEEEVTRITNAPFILARDDDFAGNCDLRLTISTAEVDEAKAQELAFMLQTIGNNLGLGMSKILLSEIARLRKMPDLAEAIKSYEPEPDPLTQQKAQLEMQLIQAQIANLQAQAQEASAKSQVQSAKVGVEQARAESLQSDADLKSQDFVRKSTGRDHAEAMDKLRVDADARLAQEQLKNDGVLEKQFHQANIDNLKGVPRQEFGM